MKYFKLFYLSAIHPTDTSCDIDTVLPSYGNGIAKIDGGPWTNINLEDYFDDLHLSIDKCLDSACLDNTSFLKFSISLEKLKHWTDSDPTGNKIRLNLAITLTTEDETVF